MTNMKIQINIIKRVMTIAKCRTPNGRFGASGAVARPKVCANLEVLRPSERQWKPRLRQAAGTLGAISADSAVRVKNSENNRIATDRKIHTK